MKTVLKTLVVFMFVFALSAHAQEDAQTLHTKAQALRTLHQELKAQIDTGVLTAEEARAEWKKVIESFRAEKEQFIADKMARIQERYEKYAEIHPERAELIKQRLENFETQKAIAVEKRAQIRSQVESGEITRKEAVELKREVHQERKLDIQAVQGEIRVKQLELRETRREQRGTSISDRQEARDGAGIRNVIDGRVVRPLNKVRIRNIQEVSIDPTATQ